MDEQMLKRQKQLLMQQRKRKRRLRLVGMLSCFVVFCTTYALILPAITMEKAVFCGKTEHQHDEGCYTKSLICALPTEEVIPGHTHTEDCWQHESVLSCGLEESEGHTHTDACWYTEQTLTCGREGEEGHVHDESCYTTTQTLICGQEESAGHIHTEACYTAVDTLICGQEERPDTVTVIHEHTEDCYETVLTCSLEEHTHTLSCYSNPEADLESASNWESGIPALTGDRAADLIRVAGSQVGYRESQANYAVQENDTVKGYTRYGAWYGNPYGDWSGMFAAFCLNYANIPQSLFPYDEDCQRWAGTLAQCGMYAAGGYIPKAGDLVFLNENGECRAGIITGVSEGGTIDTVEGDSADAVRCGSYALTSGSIMGYGILPAESPEAETEPQTELETESETELQTEAETEAETEPQTEAETENKTEPQTEAESEIETEPQTEAETENETEPQTEAETEIETEPQTEEETEIETEPGELAASGADYTVTVSYTAEAEIPENAELLVEEIGQGSEAFCAELEKTNAALQEQSGSYVCRARFFDITIIDADGNEIEPKAAVNVQILLGDEAQMKENLTVTHTDAQGTSLVQAAETSEANGEVAVVFEAEGFSTYGISQTTQNEPAEIAVGESVELQGTAATYHSWSSADTGIVTVSGTGDVGTALGAAASETVIRITHGYGKNKNNIEAEYFYIRVVDDGTLINSNTGYTVTVKGNKKILADAELIVEEIAPESGENSGYYSQMVSDIDSGLSTDVGERDSVFDFLRMYHIYLSKDGGATEYDPSAEEAAQNININLQVTITYDSAPEGWPSQNGSLYVGHYKKNASGEIENKGFADADGVKQIKISGNSITFHIQGFSVIMAGALSSPGSTSSGTQEGVDLSFSTGSLSAADIEEYNSSGANLWAVSSVGAYQSVNGTRIVKYVEPTNIEDVFKVTVAVERNIEDADLQKILEAMPAFILNENKNNVDSPVGTVLEPKEEQNGDCYGSSDESKALDQNDYFYVHYQYSFTENGKTVIKDLANIKMYRASGSSNGQNHGIVGILPDGKWIVIDTTNFKWNGHGTHDVSLSQAQYEALVDAATPTVDVTGVTDYLDTDRFIYLGTAAENTKTKGTDSPTVFLSGTTATVPDENGKITWSGNGWSSLEATDTASMSYYVRLKTSTLDGAASDINAMKFGASGPIAGTGTAYGLSDKKTTASVVAQQAVIENNTISQKQTKCTIETTQPSVKGLLYYINVEKLEKDSSPAKHLEGAAFALYSGKGTTGTPAAVITTDETGFGISAPGLPWGTYTLVETKAPEGYRLPDNPVIGTYTLAYTGDRTAGGNGAGTAEVVDSDKPGKNLIGSSAVTNEPIQDIPVTLVKLGMDSVDTDISEASCLGGAVFELYKVTEDEENKEKYEDISEAKLLSASDADSGVFSARDMRLESGTYVLRESKAPEGYYRIINDLSFKVDAGAEDPRAVIIATGSASNIAISYKTDSSGGETAYTVKVINRSGVELPETGGIGTLPYTSGGAGLILLSCLMYGYSLRRKRERRSD